MTVYAVHALDYATALGLEAGDRYDGLPIVASPLGSPTLYVLAEPVDLLILETRGQIAPGARPEIEAHPLFVGPWPPPVIERPFGVLSFENMVLSWGDLLEAIDPILRAVDYGAGVEVVVGDTGVKPAHEFWEAVATVLSGELVDTHGHGSFVASQIARLLPNAPIRSVRLLDGPQGSGSESGIVNKLGLLADLALRDPRPRAMNNSWGSEAVSQGINDAYRRCSGAGIIMGCAAGNSGPGAQPGSPVTASPLVAGAYDWRNDLLASFSSGGDRWPLITVYCAGVQEWGIGIGGFNHYHQSSGTSMADPYLTALCAMLKALHPAWTAAQMGAQLQAWAQPLAQPTQNRRGRGYMPLAAVEGTVDKHEIIWRFEEISARIDEAQRLRGEVETNPEAWNALYNRELGPIKDLCAQGVAEAKKAEPPPPEQPPPVAYDSFGGSYGAPGQHSPAFDLYPNGEDGPHLGYQFRCPVAGTVERYSFVSPLAGPLVAEHETAAALDGMPMIAQMPASVAPLVTAEEAEIIRTLGTQMHIAVFRPASPLPLENGQTVRALWIGHVAPGFATGARQAGAPLALCGMSGIEFQNGSEAAHGHVCGSTDGSLTPNGSVDGYLVARALGFTPRRTTVPGPNEYLTGQGFRGKFR